MKEFRLGKLLLELRPMLSVPFRFSCPLFNVVYSSRDTTYGSPALFRFLWRKGAGKIGGWTFHVRLGKYAPYHAKRRQRPILGVTTSANKWV